MLTNKQKELLDLRYTSYNVDQTVNGPDTPVDLVCALHGPYKCLSRDISSSKTRYTLRPPQCEGCKDRKATDANYRRQIRELWSVHVTGNEYIDPADYPIHPDFVFMKHWNQPI